METRKVHHDHGRVLSHNQPQEPAEIQQVPQLKKKAAGAAASTTTPTNEDVMRVYRKVN